MNKGSIKGVAKKVGDTLSKNSPTLLTGLSVAGLISTTVMAVSATPKALRVLDMERERSQVYDIPKIEIVKLLWPYYVPSLLMGAVTTGCMIGANSINLKRNAALASVYSITESTLKEYQSKVIDTIGEKKEGLIQDEIAKDRIEKVPVVNGDITITGKGDTLCFDSITGRYFKSDIEEIRKAENVLNKRLLDHDFVPLNDVYGELGLEYVRLGDEVGWTIESGLIAFKFSTQLSKDGTPCLVVDYIVTPRYDYMD